LAIMGVKSSGGEIEFCETVLKNRTGLTVQISIPVQEAKLITIDDR